MPPGAPLRHPRDAAKLREQYMSNLLLESANNQKNLNSNRIFKLTGTPPAVLPDTRSTTEKAADLEGSKLNLRVKLSTVSDGTIASQIVAELSPEQIRFALDKWNTISEDMKRQYAQGVPSSVFIAYLNRLIQKSQEAEQVQQGLQQNVGEAIIMSNVQLLYGLPRGQIWSVLKGAISRVERQFDLNLTETKTKISQQEQLVPSDEDLQMINGLPANIQMDIKNRLNDIYQDFPTPEDLANAVGQLNLGMANRDKPYTLTELRNLDLLVTVPDSTRENVRAIKDLLQAPMVPAAGIVNEPQEPPDFGLPAVPTAAQRIAFAPIDRAQFDALRTKKDKADYLNAVFEFAPYVALEYTRVGRGGSRTTTQVFKGPRPLNPDSYTREQLTEMYSSSVPLIEGLTSGATTGAGMVGYGLKPKIKPRQISHLVDKPMEKPKPYTQFGRYFVNKHRLHENDILAFRSPSGGNIPAMPTERVSPQLAHVMRILVGKGLPTYEDIFGLSQEDKKKLSNICNKAHVESPAVPNMKGEGQAEEDRFNILRGEITAGNDSPKIAKEFKAMLLKFMAEGRVPRQQGNAILHEMLSLGV